MDIFLGKLASGVLTATLLLNISSTPAVVQKPLKNQAILPVVIKIEVIATGYSSTHDQTDSTPFLTASNKSVRDGIIAANFLDFGTKVKIPKLYGDKIFIVEDRMHKRFSNYFPPHIDIWFESREEAKKFGAQEVEIEILN